MANEYRGERALTLNRGVNGTTETLEFVYRLTLGGAAEATSALSREQGRLVSEGEIITAIASGGIHLRILTHLLFQGIQGQHGIRRVEDAGELLAGNSILKIQKVVLRSYNEVIALLFTEEDMVEIADLQAAGETAGKVIVPVDGTPGAK